MYSINSLVSEKYRFSYTEKKTLLKNATKVEILPKFCYFSMTKFFGSSCTLSSKSI